jgi:hypothetical protein
VLSRDEVVRLSAEYLDACNGRAWDALGEWLAVQVPVTDRERDRLT